MPEAVRQGPQASTAFRTRCGRLLIAAPVAALALPAEGQPTEEVERFISQVAMRLARLADPNRYTAVIQAIRRAQFRGCQPDG
jgi:hypothetical protein